jgi:hypothetical protein
MRWRPSISDYKMGISYPILTEKKFFHELFDNPIID